MSVLYIWKPYYEQVTYIHEHCRVHICGIININKNAITNRMLFTTGVYI